jgi:hypothetical protein
MISIRFISRTAFQVVAPDGSFRTIRTGVDWGQHWTHIGQGKFIFDSSFYTTIDTVVRSNWRVWQWLLNLKKDQ